MPRHRTSENGATVGSSGKWCGHTESISGTLLYLGGLTACLISTSAFLKPVKRLLSMMTPLLGFGLLFSLVNSVSKERGFQVVFGYIYSNKLKQAGNEYEAFYKFGLKEGEHFNGAGSIQI